MNCRRPVFQQEHALLVLTGLLVLSSAAYFPLSSGSILADLPEIVIALGVLFGLAVYSARLVRGEYAVERVKRMTVYGWTGAVGTSLGVWWFVQRLQRELAVTLVLDEVLTVVSIGSGIGVFVGAHIIHERSAMARPDRDRLVAETVWTNEPQPDPILVAVTEQIAEIEGVDPLELEPLYEHVNPEVFAELRASDNSQWQLLFYTEEYEIRVSSQGTVSIYRTDERNDDRGVTVSPRGRR